MAVNVKFLADIGNWLSGLGKSQQSLEDNEEGLADLMEEATRLGLQIGKTTDEIARDFHDAFGTPIDQAEKAIEGIAKEGDKTQRELDRNFDAIGDSASDAGRDVGRNMDKGFDKAKAGVDEFKDEASGTAREVAASFDGSIESIAGGFQEIAANAFAGLGPAGVVAGLAAAAGIGQITEAFTKAQEASDAARDSAYQYGLAVAASGQYADAASRLNELTGSIEGLKQVQDIATISGWRQKDVLKALATGDGLPALTKAFEDGANNTMIATKRALELQGALEGTAQGFDLATDGATLQARALYDLAMQAGTATGEVDDLGNAIILMPDGKEIVVDAKTKKAYEDLDAIEKKKLSPKTVPVKMVVDDVAVQQWRAPLKRGEVEYKAPYPAWAANALGSGRVQKQ